MSYQEFYNMLIIFLDEESADSLILSLIIDHSIIYGKIAQHSNTFSFEELDFY